MNTTSRPARRSEADRGSASIELVILFPALLLLVTALVQYGLWFHARSVALAAAQEGVAAARSLDATPSAGSATALAFVRAHGGESLLDVAATMSATGLGGVEVVVTGRSQSVLPGVQGLAVVQRASAPVERFVQRGQP